MIVITAGLLSSASTWANNIVRELMCARTPARPPASQFADTLSGLPPAGGDLLLKSHHPRSDLCQLAAGGEARLIVTLRDPRDAVASLMQRFGRSFEQSCRDIASSLAYLDALPLDRALVLRYEDRFMDSPDTILAIARFLGIECTEALARTLAGRYSTNAVAVLAKAIPGLPSSQVRQEVDSMIHLETGFHTNHVTDARVGKHADVLDARQRVIVNGLLGTYLLRHGYSTGVPRIPVECFSLQANARRVESLVLLSAGEGSDCMIYGPYMNLPAGRWEARFLMEAASDAEVLVDVALAGDGISAARLRLPPDRARTLEFFITDPASEIEFRVFSPRGADVLFRGVELVRP